MIKEVKCKELKDRIIRKLFCNEEYAEFLCGQDLAYKSIIDMICAAPVSLEIKANMFKELSEHSKGEEASSYLARYNEIEKALAGLKLKEGEIFMCVAYTREYGRATQFDSFVSKNFNYVSDIVATETEEEKEGNKDYNCWYVLKKWRPVTEKDKQCEYFKGDMTEDYNYTFVNGKVCYFDNFWEEFDSKTNDSEENKFSLFYSGDSLNLPTPWKEGDILEIDSTPFSPKVRVVVLNTVDGCDCCFPCCLYLTQKGVDAGALKHSHIYKNSISENISPLYSAKRFTGELAEDETVLKIVADYIKGDKARGDKIFNIVIRKHKGDGNRDFDALRKLMLIKYIGFLREDGEK